jgi:cell wall-associated NlpC family hydrolase
MQSLLRSALVLPLLSAFALAACASPVDPSDDNGDTGETSAAISTSSCKLSRSSILASASGGRRAAIERGFGWYDARVPYSQSAYRGGYRTDCSGFVSMCWQLGTSYTTADFSTGGGKSGPLGAYSKLLPGDALVHRSNGAGHVVLFLGWNDSAHSAACVLEQASTASDMQFRARSTSSLTAGGYKAIRADKLASSGGSAPSAGEEPADDEPNAPAGSDTEPSSGGSSGGQSCTSTGDCNPGNDGSGLICVAGTCKAGCLSDAQCPGSTSCVGGQCR